MSLNPLVPDTRVLAIASHVVHGYVGNTMAVFVMQALGCEVAALNTVQFSNHTAYGQYKGTKATAQEIHEIYEGLQQNDLVAFDVLLSGYAFNAEVLRAIGSIARDLRRKALAKPGSFFWVLDPVMGDNGRLYVNEDVVPVYKNLLRDADMILPNQFEAELLSSIKITSVASLTAAIATLHQIYRIPHIIITSVSPFSSTSGTTTSVVGSTARADGSPRLFKIDVPAIDCFFSGTGDMFAALTVVRFREATVALGLGATAAWMSPDEVAAVDLPLAKAVELVMGSMQAVLLKTKAAHDADLEDGRGGGGTGDRLRRMKAAEVRVVRNLGDLREPGKVWRAEALGNGAEVGCDGKEKSK